MRNDSRQLWKSEITLPPSLERIADIVLRRERNDCIRFGALHPEQPLKDRPAGAGQARYREDMAQPAFIRFACDPTGLACPTARGRQVDAAARVHRWDRWHDGGVVAGAGAKQQNLPVIGYLDWYEPSPNRPAMIELRAGLAEAGFTTQSSRRRNPYGANSRSLGQIRSSRCTARGTAAVSLTAESLTEARRVAAFPVSLEPLEARDSPPGRSRSHQGDARGCNTQA